MPNQFLSDEFGDIEDYFVTDYWLIDQYIGDQLFIWGFGNEGRLGRNDTSSTGVPVTTFAGGTTWKQVACSGANTAAIKTDGTLWNWGASNFGQLGTNDNTPNRLTPVTTFAGGNNWKQVSRGPNYTVAVKTDGSLWSMGRNEVGELGINLTGERFTPVTTFTGGNNWKSVACGEQHTVAIKTDGSLWTWGNNNSGQLGINNLNNRSIPVTTFVGGNNWKQVACGNLYTAAIKTDGSLWTWGTNGAGELGDNTATNRRTPVTTFAGGNNWKSVGCGENHTIAIKTDGSLWTWGYNIGGQLGDNTGITRSTPVTTFAGGTNWKSIDGGKTSTAAIKTDGTLWVWGIKTFGVLGVGDGNIRSTPVIIVGGGNNWKQVDTADTHSAAIKSGLNVDLS